MVEIAHHLFQLAFRHLPVADTNSRFRHQLGQLGCAFFDGVHFIVQEVHLAAAQQLTQDGFLDHRRLLLHDEGLDGQPPRRRCGDDRQVAHAGHGHVQRTRNGCGGQVEDIHFTAQGLEAFLLPHPEAVLFVNNDQPKLFEFDVF